MATPYWQHLIGNALSATPYWQHLIGNALLATPYWQHLIGNALLATPYWQHLIGNTLLATPYWQRLVGNPLLAVVIVFSSGVVQVDRTAHGEISNTAQGWNWSSLGDFVYTSIGGERWHHDREAWDGLPSLPTLVRCFRGMFERDARRLVCLIHVVTRLFDSWMNEVAIMDFVV